MKRQLVGYNYEALEKPYNKANAERTVTPRTPYEKLIVRYACGMPVCNCGQAYYWPTTKGSISGEGVTYTDMLGCRWGCSANQIWARDHVAELALAELPPDSQK